MTGKEAQPENSEKHHGVRSHVFPILVLHTHQLNESSEYAHHWHLVATLWSQPPSASGMAAVHLHDELKSSPRIHVETKYGKLTGGRAENGAAVFLGVYSIWASATDLIPTQEIPYGLPPARFQDPKPLPPDFRYAEREYTRELNCTAFPYTLNLIDSGYRCNAAQKRWPGTR